MENTEFDAINLQVDAIQQKYLNILKAKVSSEASPFYRVQMQDMAKIIEMDEQIRKRLESAGNAVDRIELSSTLYSSFLEYMAAILTELPSASISTEVASAYSAIGIAVLSGNKLSAKQIFTCISLSFTVASICINKLDLQKQQTVISILDKLLEIKSTQLRLVEETARFQRDFTRNSQDFTLKKQKN